MWIALAAVLVGGAAGAALLSLSALWMGVLDQAAMAVSTSLLEPALLLVVMLLAALRQAESGALLLWCVLGAVP